MNRRSFLKALASGVVSYQLDIDKLLWIPGQKKIFIPSHKLITESQIVALELERVLPLVKRLFERENTFYMALKS